MRPSLAPSRVLIVAPTRASCETIEAALHLEGVETRLERECGEEIRNLASRGAGFGILAGTGTGKTLSIRSIAQTLLGPELRIGVVNREREATPETPTWNVIVITTGIARLWLQEGSITEADTLIVDEIHQTSAELEVCLALGKRAGCRFIWMSATVDPALYATYLNSEAVVRCSGFDADKAACVRTSSEASPEAFLHAGFMRRVREESRGVAVFVPTRAEAESVARTVETLWPGVATAFYHGGESVDALTPYLEGTATRPFVLSMTAAGQSALNLRGLDTVVILDERLSTVPMAGRSVLVRSPLGANEILQMAGRVHGRVADSEVWILTRRPLDFASLRPELPTFQLAADPERLALTCAALGVPAESLDWIAPYDPEAYASAVRYLEGRGLIHEGRLTEYGNQVERLPVDRPWAEMLLDCPADLLPYVAAAAATESLHRMTREERDIDSYLVPGSDSLSAYQVYQDALWTCGGLGNVWGLSRHVFDPEALRLWADERGVLVRSIEESALALASLYRALKLDLPRSLPPVTSRVMEAWQERIARLMPFDLVREERTVAGDPVWSSPGGQTDPSGTVAGVVRYFLDRSGDVRASVEGTQLTEEQVQAHAQVRYGPVRYLPKHRTTPLRIQRFHDFHGLILEAEEQVVEEFPEDRIEDIHHCLAEALTLGVAIHRDVPANQGVLQELREVHRRSGGEVSKVRDADVIQYFRQRLRSVRSYAQFKASDMTLDADHFVEGSQRKRWMALPSEWTLAGHPCPLDYGVEEETPVVRVRIPAKVFQRLSEADIPSMDRPVHWTLLRDKQEALRASSFEEAHSLLRK